jgi:hypothetical protein
MISYQAVATTESVLLFGDHPLGIGATSVAILFLPIIRIGYLAAIVRARLKRSITE